MINFIESDEHLIRLSASSLSVPNIFDVTSLSLLIGNNGSGKTSLLNKIMDKFTAAAKKDRFSCDIHLDSQRLLGFDEIRESWGVIYYSPIPYGRKRHPTKNLIDASPNWVKPISAFDIGVHADILDEFNISPKIYARKTVDVRRVCRAITDLIIVQNDKAKEDEQLCDIAAPLIEFIESAELETTLSLEDRQERMYSREREERKLVDTVASRIYQRIREREDSQERTFSVFVVFDHILSAGADGAKIIKSLACEVLGVQNFEGALSDRSSLHISKAFSDIDRLNRFLNKRKASFTFGARSSFEVQLDRDKDANVLSEFKIAHLIDVGFQNMSSGQLAIVAQLSLISQAVNKLAVRGIKKLLLLIDEGDAFLHLEWQRKYVGQINNLLGRIRNEHQLISFQVIIATHSPLLATDVPKQFICRMESAGENSAPSSFAAPLHALLNQSFGAKTIGEFASLKINQAVRNLSEGGGSDVDRFIISSIDNPIIKGEVFRVLASKGVEF